MTLEQNWPQYPRGIAPFSLWTASITRVYMKYELLIFKIKFNVNLKFHSKGDFQKTLLKEAGFLHNLRLESSLFHIYTLL